MSILSEMGGPRSLITLASVKIEGREKPYLFANHLRDVKAGGEIFLSASFTLSPTGSGEIKVEADDPHDMMKKLHGGEVTVHETNEDGPGPFDASHGPFTLRYMKRGVAILSQRLPLKWPRVEYNPPPSPLYSPDPMRKQFEQFMRDEYSLHSFPRTDECYDSGDTERMWHVWQGSRRALMDSIYAKSS